MWFGPCKVLRMGNADMPMPNPLEIPAQICLHCPACVACGMKYFDPLIRQNWDLGCLWCSPNGICECEPNCSACRAHCVGNSWQKFLWTGNWYHIVNESIYLVHGHGACSTSPMIRMDRIELVLSLTPGPIWRAQEGSKTTQKNQVDKLGENVPICQ